MWWFMVHQLWGFYLGNKVCLISERGRERRWEILKGREGREGLV